MEHPFREPVLCVSAREKDIELSQRNPIIQ